jgi:hypothetical protein
MDPARFTAFSLKTQLGHITAEIVRARGWADKGQEDYSRSAISRALELLSFSEAGAKTFAARREMARLKELVAQFYNQDKVYDVTLAELEAFLHRIVVV